jgi:acyl carrier protein
VDVQQKLADYLCREYLNNDRSRVPGPDQPLLSAEGGPVDSVGLHQLITFVESGLGVTVDDLDIVPENFATLRALSRYVEGKQRQ